ncbi:MAG: hypothetical protein R6V44_16490 [Paracoccaceae bacterium]
MSGSTGGIGGAKRALSAALGELAAAVETAAARGGAPGASTDGGTEALLERLTEAETARAEAERARGEAAATTEAAREEAGAAKAEAAALRAELEAAQAEARVAAEAIETMRRARAEDAELIEAALDELKAAV